MGLSFYIKLYLLTVPVFFGLDMLWLGLIAKSFYQNNLGFILSPKVNWLAAVVFYLIYIVGILIFAVNPALETREWQKALVLGGLFGFFTYATYELTNMALIQGWPFKVVVVDILWGAVLCSAVAVAGFFIGQWLRG
jgi:uncharacterized membrane protein